MIACVVISPIPANLPDLAGSLGDLPRTILEGLDILPADNAAHFKMFDSNRLAAQILTRCGGGRPLSPSLLTLRSIMSPAPLWLHCGGIISLQLNDAHGTDHAANALRFFEGIGVRQERPDEMISSLCQSIEQRGTASKWSPPPFLVVPADAPLAERLTIVEASGNQIGNEIFVTMFLRYRPDSEQLREMVTVNQRALSVDSEGLNHCCPAISMKSQLFTGGLKALLLAGSDAPY